MTNKEVKKQMEVCVKELENTNLTYKKELIQFLKNMINIMK